MNYQQATYLMGAAKLPQLPEDVGVEVAFAGRSNAGKSSALNALTQQKHLAKTSKTPGRTQLINLFTLDETRRLVDLPGYGYAKVPMQVKLQWQKTLERYLQERDCLKGLVLVTDSRHPLKEMDCQMVEWSIQSELPCHILLSKADKLTNQEKSKVLKLVKSRYEHDDLVSVQLFSSLRHTGLDQLRALLDQWYGA